MAKLQENKLHFYKIAVYLVSQLYLGTAVKSDSLLAYA